MNTHLKIGDNVTIKENSVFFPNEIVTITRIIQFHNKTKDMIEVKNKEGIKHFIARNNFKI